MAEDELRYQRLEGASRRWHRLRTREAGVLRMFCGHAIHWQEEMHTSPAGSAAVRASSCRKCDELAGRVVQIS